MTVAFIFLKQIDTVSCVVWRKQLWFLQIFLSFKSKMRVVEILNIFSLSISRFEESRGGFAKWCMYQLQV